MMGKLAVTLGLATTGDVPPEQVKVLTYLPFSLKIKCYLFWMQT